MFKSIKAVLEGRGFKPNFMIKIMLVEDDTLLSATLAKVLEAHHYTIDRASDGQAGVRPSNRS